MRRYKKSKCRNGWKTCGKSRRCYPPETECSELQRSEEKPEQTAEKAERKIPIAAIITATAATAVLGGVAYAVHQTRNKTIYLPKKAETVSDPKPSYTPTETPKIDIKQNLPEEEFVPGMDRPEIREASFNNKFKNQADASEWAKKMLNDPNTVILDLETTALLENRNFDPYSPDSWRKYKRDVPGITQIGMMDGGLNEALDIKLNPEREPSNFVVEQMTGYDKEKAKNMPTFKDYYPRLKERLTGKNVLAFNARFDMQVLDSLCIKNDLPLIDYVNRPLRPNKVGINPSPMDNEADVMHWFALYKYKGARPSLKGGKYKVEEGLAFTSLPTIQGGNAHDAITDVLSTYDVLRIMADGKTPPGMDKYDQQRWDMYEDRKRSLYEEKGRHTISGDMDSVKSSWEKYKDVEYPKMTKEERYEQAKRKRTAGSGTFDRYRTLLPDEERLRRREEDEKNRKRKKKRKSQMGQEY